MRIETCAAVVLWPAILSAQVAGSGADISVRVDLVVLNATVLDRRGHIAPDLPERNFQVYEDGVPQTVKLFLHEDRPVCAGLILDDSGSMRPKRPQVLAAASAFARSSNVQDQVFIVNFNEHVSLGLPPGSWFAHDTEQLQRAIMDSPAAGKTALYDAVLTGLTHLKQCGIDKKVLLVISDGGDNASSHGFRQVLDEVQRSNAVIYCIGMFTEYDRDQNPQVLKKLAAATGGQAFFPERMTEATGICERIARDIRSQYTIGYAPSNQNSGNGYHAIKVTAVDEKRHGLVVLTRAGYLAGERRP